METGRCLLHSLDAVFPAEQGCNLTLHVSKGRACKLGGKDAPCLLLPVIEAVTRSTHRRSDPAGYRPSVT